MALLEDITVVALEQAVAAPLASRHLADWGARVIKIERPGSGDFARNYDKTVKGLSSHFVWLNRSKLSLTLDVKKPKGKEILRRLLADADVFIQNLAPGAVDRLGFGSNALRESYPRLIVCNLSGYGDDGPYRDKKSYDLLVQAEAGLLSITGTEDTPSKAGISIADIAAGMYAYSGILAALLRRSKTGEGTIVDVSLFDAMAEWMSYPAYFTAYGGAAPARTGAHHATIAPYGPVTVAGGKTVVIGLQNEREWVEFCRTVLLRPELIGDERFKGNQARNRNRAVLDKIMHSELGAISLDEMIDRLETARIAYGRMNTMQEFFDHVQLAARNRWIQVDTPAGPISVMLPPVNMAGETIKVSPIPDVGEHSVQILESLGYSSTDINHLNKNRVI
jgi:itaconate CoA-transferase